MNELTRFFERVLFYKNAHGSYMLLLRAQEMYKSMKLVAKLHRFHILFILAVEHLAIMFTFIYWLICKPVKCMSKCLLPVSTFGLNS